MQLLYELLRDVRRGTNINWRGNEHGAPLSIERESSNHANRIYDKTAENARENRSKDPPTPVRAKARDIVMPFHIVHHGRPISENIREQILSICQHQRTFQIDHKILERLHLTGGRPAYQLFHWTTAVQVRKVYWTFR